MTASILLIGNTLLLGLRHGLDFDHLAAISDIVGASSGRKDAAVKLAACYVIGHAVVVIALGALVIFLGSKLPPSIDYYAEKVVAVTLIVLGLWLACRLPRQRNPRPPASASRSSIATTASVGMIHGIGAETGTQMLLLATVSGTSTTNQLFAFVLLIVFVLGLLVSNSLITAASVAGFTAGHRFKTISRLLGIITVGFSVGLGLSMLF